MKNSPAKYNVESHNIIDFSLTLPALYDDRTSGPLAT